ncbi:MAG: hypothetical protein IKG75_05955, partial [Bacteroidaceae bacterium]|nr:hypothetical protein [Bacteroidaceae bacterium]
ADELANATDNRVVAIAQAMQMGYSVEQIHSLTKIDKWFLYKLRHIVDIDQHMKEYRYLSDLIVDMDSSEFAELIEEPCFADLLREAKVYGFSDSQIASAIGLDATLGKEEAGLKVRKWRKDLGILPVVNQIDTLAAEYPAQTNYLYMTYL